MRALLLLTLLLVPMASAGLEIDFGDDCYDCDEPYIDYEMMIVIVTLVAFVLLLVAVVVAASN